MQSDPSLMADADAAAAREMRCSLSLHSYRLVALDSAMQITWLQQPVINTHIHTTRPVGQLFTAGHCCSHFGLIFNYYLNH